MKTMEEEDTLRDKLVGIALQWQACFGVAPAITSSLSEYDAAMLVGMSEKEHSDYMKDKLRSPKERTLLVSYLAKVNYFC